VADRPLKLRELRRILKRYGIFEDSSLGKGSHTTFVQVRPTGTLTYPVPTTRSDILICYVRGCRKRFGLSAEDGVTDKEFYG
jgi:hypothetical protein